MGLSINEEYFGVLLPLIKDDKITDITWNGRNLWVDHLEKGRYKSEIVISSHFVVTLAARIANLANKNFNVSEPLLEAETDELRLSFINENVTNTDISVAIRKTPAVMRLKDSSMIEQGYADDLMIRILECLIKSHCSIIVAGDVGSGKTELVKYLTKYIPDYERTISIEDNFELRLSAINPSLDCVELKANEYFDYSECIKASLRQLCKWMLLSEARSREVASLLEAASTGCCCLTTIHADDVRKIPDRIKNMIGINGQEKTNEIYSFFDIGIKVCADKSQDGIKRYIQQLCVFDHTEENNCIHMIFDNRQFTGENFPHNLKRKIQESQNVNPLDEFLTGTDKERRDDKEKRKKQSL